MDLEGATAGQGRTVTLRTGLNTTVNALDPANLTIYGAASNDIINLGAGAATVYLGVGETVNGGSGNDTVFETAPMIGQALTGGTGANTLKLVNGGTLTMGSNITGVPSVFLDNSAPTTSSPMRSPAFRSLPAPGTTRSRLRRHRRR